MKDCFQLSRFINIDSYEPKIRRIKISELLNKSFVINKCTRFDKSRYNKPFYKLQIRLDDKDYIFNTGSSVILSELDDLTKQFSKLEDMNVYVKLIMIYGSYKLIDGEDNECTNI